MEFSKWDVSYYVQSETNTVANLCMPSSIIIIPQSTMRKNDWSKLRHSMCNKIQQWVEHAMLVVWKKRDDMIVPRQWQMTSAVTRHKYEPRQLWRQTNSSATAEKTWYTNIAQYILEMLIWSRSRSTMSIPNARTHTISSWWLIVIKTPTFHTLGYKLTTHPTPLRLDVRTKEEPHYTFWMTHTYLWENWLS